METIPQVLANLRNNSLDCIMQNVARGLDPENYKLFQQSKVIGQNILELMLVMECLIPVCHLEQMT